MTTPPAILVLLSELGSYSVNTKVRFIGCVTDYDIPTATLTLVSQYPARDQDDGVNSTASTVASTKLLRSAHASWRRSTCARVSARLILPTPTSSLEYTQLFKAGAWVNVIGYVSSRPEGAVTAEDETCVTATLLSSARTADVSLFVQDKEGAGKYERAIKGMREAREALRVSVGVSGKG